MKSLCNSAWKFMLLFSTLACNNSTNTPGATTSSPLVFDKIVGTWQDNKDGSFERWTKKHDGTFQSVVFTVTGSDTSWNEQANIYPENGHWIFENRVKDQNAGATVKFASSLLAENAVQFSNPSHDFPTDINYTVVDNNTIHAFIIGPNQQGGKDTVPYNYIRVKE